jgi:hypothetical protein
MLHERPRKPGRPAQEQIDVNETRFPKTHLIAKELFQFIGDTLWLLSLFPSSTSFSYLGASLFLAVFIESATQVCNLLPREPRVYIWMLTPIFRQTN